MPAGDVTRLRSFESFRADCRGARPGRPGGPLVMVAADRSAGKKSAVEPGGGCLEPSVLDPPICCPLRGGGSLCCGGPPCHALDGVVVCAGPPPPLFRLGKLDEEKSSGVVRVPSACWACWAQEPSGIDASRAEVFDCVCRPG
jgi:hypothetical protein